MNLYDFIGQLVEQAEALYESGAGQEKKKFVIESLSKLDDKTILAIIPNTLEKEVLELLIDAIVHTLFKLHK